MVVAQIYYPKRTSIWENIASITGTIIIVQTTIHHRSKVFTTGQARVNPEHYAVADPEGGTGGTCPPPSYFLIHYLIATTLTANYSKPWLINYLTSYL